MKNRCLNPRQARFKDYAGRGITICDRWLHGDGTRSGFECFLADMGPKPSPDHTLDREENEDGYKPSNCRWATRLEQANNKRTTRYVEPGGLRMSVAAASRRFKAASPHTIHRRLRLGWDEEDAVLTPTGRRPFPPMEVCF